MVSRTQAVSPSGKTPSRKTAKAASVVAAKSVALQQATVATRKPRALSLHIGLNVVSPAHYGGWSGELAACEFDAEDMATIARSRGIKPTVLLSRGATRAKVLAAMRAAAKALVQGDLFVLSYSGHGGQVSDVTGEEDDRKDETWCLHDGQLIDDELYLELSRFAAGVRILVLSDSCHSGTVTRDSIPVPAQAQARSRAMPPAIARRTYLAHQDFYDRLQREVLAASGSRPLADPDAALAALSIDSSRLNALVGDFKPAVILISGCQDNQTSMDGEHNGAFTGSLLQIWRDGAFQGSYRQFHSRIRAGLPASQSPNLFVLGDARRFLAQTPFSVW
ncbi:caspase domain-containing protein [Sphaerotilus hippei]|uniref:Caspase domain-containing protein n=1 Tax=Sphaerotilus hippei TaxID=744406 RepID=A0A318GVS3_9BURK|nr:caspase family protein [Sphaerotilus hippei]PXW93661.1 caspase domain-containing protein [Sphaerotilus hippei]